MKIGLLDIDGHNFPNLALMKLSAYHKNIGDSVEFANPMFQNYDKVYMSKVFTFTQDNQFAYNCEVIKGGTGYKNYSLTLSEEIEHICPDYSLYNTDYAVGFTTRGCINKCPWCVVPIKEGYIKPHADIKEFIGKKKKLILLDNNAIASEHGLGQMEEAIRLNLRVDYNQGLEAKVAINNPYILDLISKVKWLRYVRFACDTSNNLPHIIKCVEELSKRGFKPYRIFVYVLVKKDIQDALYRINTLKKLGVTPFAQPYLDFDNKIKPTIEQKKIARWCNHKAIFKTVDFNKYI